MYISQDGNTVMKVVNIATVYLFSLFSCAYHKPRCQKQTII